MNRYVRKITVYASSIGLASLCAVAVLSLAHPNHAAASAYNADRNCVDSSTEFNVVVVARVYDYKGNLKGYANNYTFHVNAFENNLAYRDWGGWSTWHNLKAAGHDQYDSKHDTAGGGKDDTSWRWRDWGPWIYYDSNNSSGTYPNHVPDQYSNEAKEWNRLKSESIRLWDNSYYYKTGVNADFAVQMNANFAGTTAASDGMVGSKGNACDVGGGKIVPAYAFRDGDNTNHRTLDDVNANASPYGPLGTSDQGHTLNNNSWSLSCLGQSDGSSPIKHMYFSFSPTWWDYSYVTSASAWTSRQAAQSGGSWSPPVTFWADNGRSVYAFFNYTEPTPPIVSPTASLQGSMEEGTNVTAQAFINNTTNSTGTATYNRQFWYEDNGNDTLDATDQQIGTGDYSGSAAFGANTSVSLGDWGPFVLDGTHTRVCTRLLITGVSNAGLIAAGTNPSRDCRNIIRKPYLSSYGADIVAGSYPAASGTSCTAVAGAGVIGWNHDAQAPVYGAGDYAGGGSRTAVFASGNISHFASGLNITSLKPTGLSFANTVSATGGQVNLATNNYGGKFAAQLPTGCDFTSGTPTAWPGYGSVPSPASFTAHKYYTATGNVYIGSGGIKYAGSGGWASLASIPSFKLVVTGGNIYIDNDVTELDGLYVAVPNSVTGVGGEIFTCATASGSPVPRSDNITPTYNDQCGSRLKIYGAFAAKTIHFGRTYGTLGQAKTTDDYSTDKSAEQFIYSPEMWLPNGSGNSGFSLKNYQGLPPVL